MVERAATRIVAPLSATERRLRQRHRDDLTYYAPRALKIRVKGGDIKPLRFNDAQSLIHTKLQDQLKREGRIRALVLKGRQQGCSTYVQARYFWRVTHQKGVRAYILTHVEEASANLFAMVRRFYDHCPTALRPKLGTANARGLTFGKLESGYRVATAGGRAAGRSDTIQFFHGSEVAYWPNAADQVAGALQAVPAGPGSEVILESTSSGPRGLFHDLVQRALAGEPGFDLIFVPWFLQREYRLAQAEACDPSGEERDYAKAHGLDLGQIAWRRSKIRELGGAHRFRREYPATIAEAFAADRPGARWQRSLLDGVHVARAPALNRIVVALDPSGGGAEGHDEAGIVVAGLGADQRFYVLDDRSGRMSPAAWAQATLAAFAHHRADRIVAEKNFGGDMVGEVIRALDPQAPISLVSASRGKAVRAEPIAALYEQGRVAHVGRFLALEEEMASWVPGESAKSPNRLDALVWALTALSRTGPGGFSFG